MTTSVLVDGRTPSLEAVECVARDPSVRVALSEEAAERVARSREFIEAKVRSDEPIYGVTTGFGRLADVTIPLEQRTTLQEDHVSMGLTAARKARRAVAWLERDLTIELLCAAQSIEYRRPLRVCSGRLARIATEAEA